MRVCLRVSEKRPAHSHRMEIEGDELMRTRHRHRKTCYSAVRRWADVAVARRRQVCWFLIQLNRARASNRNDFVSVGHDGLPVASKLEILYFTCHLHGRGFKNISFILFGAFMSGCSMFVRAPAGRAPPAFPFSAYKSSKHLPPGFRKPLRALAERLFKMKKLKQELAGALRWFQ